jgi:hydrogenase maturation protein HypF
VILLLSDLGFPVVATSGNRTDEPICIDEHEAVKRLAGIADFFLVHDRPIVRPVEDSVARVIDGGVGSASPRRGYAPPDPVFRRAGRRSWRWADT